MNGFIRIGLLDEFINGFVKDSHTWIHEWVRSGLIQGVTHGLLNGFKVDVYMNSYLDP